METLSRHFLQDKSGVVSMGLTSTFQLAFPKQFVNFSLATALSTSWIIEALIGA